MGGGPASVQPRQAWPQQAGPFQEERLLLLGCLESMAHSTPKPQRHLTPVSLGTHRRGASPADTGSTYSPGGLPPGQRGPPTGKHGPLGASPLPRVERHWGQDGQKPACHGDAGGSRARWKRGELSRKARKLSGQQSRRVVLCPDTRTEPARRVGGKSHVAPSGTCRTHLRVLYYSEKQTTSSKYNRPS